MRSVLFAALLAALTLGSAQAPAGGEGGGLWSVQTIALRDFREAQARADILKGHGFDAFTEFTMDRGMQFVRVRVGCFTSREGAEAMAAALRGRITDTAAAVEATPGAPVAGCVNVEVGFLKPYSWDEVEEPGMAPAFRVEVAGIGAHVAHTGRGWRVLQDGEAVPALDPALPQERFSQAHVGGVPLVRLEGARGPILLCPGALINAVGGVAIVDQELALVACSLEPTGVR